MEASDTKLEIKALFELIERQRRLVPVCATDNITANRTYDVLDKLDTVIKQEIRVLVVGMFSSGKTTLLNALLGEELLFTSVVPSTAIPVELHYGAERRAVIYPRRGAWRGGDSPFEVPLSAEELRKYCGWNQDHSGNPTESLFEKAEIFTPNPVLEQGVTFVEAPATIFDATPHCRNIFQKYIHRADVLLYTMDGVVPFTNSDGTFLEEFGRILPPLIVIGHLGKINLDVRAEYFDIVRKMALQYTSILGADAIHFIDARNALRAKKTDDHELLEQSGFNQLEQYLLYELFPKKNCEKINGVIQQMEQINVDLSNQIEMQYNVDVPDDNRTIPAFRERSEELLGAQLQIELIRQELNDLRHHCE